MKLKFALAALAALGGAALSTGAASAMPIGLATNAGIASNIDQVRLVCNGYGRCFHTPGYAYRGRATDMATAGIAAGTAAAGNRDRRASALLFFITIDPRL